MQSRISGLEAEKKRLSQEVAALEADLARADRFAFRQFADRQRAAAADALGAQRDRALAAASSLNAIAHHLGETLQSGFLEALITLFTSRAHVPDAIAAFRVSWHSPRSPRDPIMTRRAARRIRIAAAGIARAFQQRGGRGFIGLSISHGDTAHELADNLRDCAHAHAVAAILAGAVGMDKVIHKRAPYRPGRSRITIALFDAAPAGWQSLADSKGHFARALSAIPLAHVLPGSIPVPFSHPRPERAGMGAALRNAGNRRPGFTSVVPGHYDVSPGLFPVSGS